MTHVPKYTVKQRSQDPNNIPGARWGRAQELQGKGKAALYLGVGSAQKG